MCYLCSYSISRSLSIRGDSIGVRNVVVFSYILLETAAKRQKFLAGLPPRTPR